MGETRESGLHRAESLDGVPTGWCECGQSLGHEYRAALAAPPEPDLPALDDEGIEARRLLGYLWNATGKNHLRPVRDLFAEDDPIVADVERLGIFPSDAPGPLGVAPDASGEGANAPCPDCRESASDKCTRHNGSSELARPLSEDPD